MKTFLKVIGIIILAFIILAYLAFLFILPRKLDLNTYKKDIQKLALEQSHLNIDFKDIRIYTTPILEAGVKINGLSIKLPDNSDLLNVDNVKTKISLPNLLLLTVRVSDVTVESPKINIDIAEDGSQYKIMSIVQNIINEQKRKKEAEAPAQTSKITFNPAWIKIKVPNINVYNYSAKINDLASGHYLALTGDELSAAFNNMKTFKVKTETSFSSDEDVNIKANVDINSFIPPAAEIDEEDDPDYRADMDFVNPVLMYRDYDLKTNIDTKLKARLSRKGNIILHGFVDVEDLTMNLSGYQLPKSYFRAKFKGNSADLDTNIYVAKNQNIRLCGNVNYSKHPKIDLLINSKPIYFNDLIILTKAFMDTLNIKNDLALMKGAGYISANAKIKTNFKKLKSNGGIIIRNGNLSNSKIGLLFKDINANILFEDKTLEIKDTHLYVNDSILKAEGKINEKSVADISIYAEKLPLPGLFAAFAPVDLKNSYSIKSGSLFLDTKLTGELKKAVSDINVILSDFDMATKDNSLRVTDKKTDIKLNSNFKTVTGNITNNDLNIYLPQTNSKISNPELNINIDEENIAINPLVVRINNSSAIHIDGSVLDYMKRPYINVKADGDLFAEDLKQILGDAAAPFISAKGTLPMRFSLSGNDKRQDIIFQIKADKLNYITPVDIESVKGLQSIIQAKITYKGNRLNIRDTGLYTKAVPTLFTEDLETNMEGTTGIATVSGTITKLDTPAPFINQISVKIPEDLKMQICAFKDSHLTFGGDMLIFGQALSPKYRGSFGIWDLTIPELYTSMKTLSLKFLAKTLYITLEDLILNGSDIQLAGNASLAPAQVFVVNNLDISSDNIDVPKLMKVSDAAMKYAPKANPNAEPADIPVALRDGSINMKRISSPPIVLTNTTGDISLSDNVFYLNRLHTSTIGGTVTGDVSANLVTMLLKAQVHGTNFDVARTFYELMAMKDTLSGTMAFDTNLSINGAAKNQQEQMKGINGTVNFEIKDGQLGPFGKLENLILAENIRESEFFQTALGGVIDSLTSVQTSHFDVLNGHIEMADGIAKLNPITSVGPVMCMNISGDMNILTNEADMKLRARLGSKIADMLGPIAAVNPVNIVKATPGLNVAAAKMFSIFTEPVTPEEMAQIPNFVEDFNKMSTTNFQVVLRGDTTKPLSLIKSFKWLATTADIENAEHFVETLPPTDPENPNATLEELLAAQAEAERIANENIFQKAVRKIKNFFSQKDEK